MSREYLPFHATMDNHLRYYFNQDPNQKQRNSNYDVACMSVGGVGKTGARSFVDSLIETAKTLSSRHGKEFLLFLSGGLDSEVAFRCFRRGGCMFRPVVVRFSQDLNIEDVTSAFRICQAAGIDPIVIDIDPLEYLDSSRWIDVAVKYQAHTFYQQMLLSISEKLAAPMLTVDEIELVKTDNGNWAFVKKEDQDGCWHRFIEKTGIPAYNNFYTYDPATISAFLKAPLVRSLVKNEIFGKLTWSSSKNDIYHQLTGWHMVNRRKRHGMEKMTNIWYHVENETSKILAGPPKELHFDADKLSQALASGKDMTCNIA